jgi:hypothetical protein
MTASGPSLAVPSAGDAAEAPAAAASAGAEPEGPVAPAPKPPAPALTASQLAPHRIEYFPALSAPSIRLVLNGAVSGFIPTLAPHERVSLGGARSVGLTPRNPRRRPAP